MKISTKTQAAINHEHHGLRARLGELIRLMGASDGPISERLRDCIDDGRALLAKINSREEREERAATQDATEVDA